MNSTTASGYASLKRAIDLVGATCLSLLFLQIINVFKGDMSLVGPRAYYPDELRDQQKKYPNTKDLVKEVLSIKPGITGVWQVSGRSEVNFDKRIAIDASYAREHSIFYDILILLRTPIAMI